MISRLFVRNGITLEMGISKIKTKNQKPKLTARQQIVGADNENARRILALDTSGFRTQQWQYHFCVCVCVLIFYICLLLALFSRSTWEKQLQHLILPGSRPARKIICFFSQLSQNLALIESSAHPWMSREWELISLDLVTWGSTQTTWTESREKILSRRKLSRFQQKWGT